MIETIGLNKLRLLRRREAMETMLALTGTTTERDDAGAIRDDGDVPVRGSSHPLLSLKYWLISQVVRMN